MSLLSLNWNLSVIDKFLKCCNLLLQKHEKDTPKELLERQFQDGLLGPLYDELMELWKPQQHQNKVPFLNQFQEPLSKGLGY